MYPNFEISTLIDSNITHDEFVLIDNFLIVGSEKKKKKKEIKNPKVARTKDGRVILLSKCDVCDSKRSKFI